MKIFGQSVCVCVCMCVCVLIPALSCAMEEFHEKMLITKYDIWSYLGTHDSKKILYTLWYHSYVLDINILYIDMSLRKSEFITCKN